MLVEVLLRPREVDEVPRQEVLLGVWPPDTAEKTRVFVEEGRELPNKSCSFFLKFIFNFN